MKSIAFDRRAEEEGHVQEKKGDRRWADTRTFELAGKGGVWIEIETKQAPEAAFDAKEASTRHIAPAEAAPISIESPAFPSTADLGRPIRHVKPDRCERRRLYV